MCRGDEQMFDEVAVLRSGAKTALAAAALARVSGDWSSLDVTTVSDCNRHVFVGDEIFDRKIDTFVDNLCPASVAKIFLDLLELFRNHATQRSLVAQDLFELGDDLDDAFVLVSN